MSNSDIKWAKVDRGYYVAPGTTYAVIADGYRPGQHIGAEASTGYEGFIAGEWAVVRFQDVVKDVVHAPAHNDGDNLDWYDTMRDAKADAERRIKFDRDWYAAGKRAS